MLDRVFDALRGSPLGSRRFRLTLGVGLITLHGLFWLAAPAVLFLGVSGTTKVVLIPTFIIIAEVTGWVAMLVLGAEAVRALRGHLNPKQWIARFRPPHPRTMLPGDQMQEVEPDALLSGTSGSAGVVSAIPHLNVVSGEPADDPDADIHGDL